MPTKRLSESDLRELEQLAVTTDVAQLVAEIRRLRSILDGIYDLVQETKGREDQLAELEREVLALRQERR